MAIYALVITTLIMMMTEIVTTKCEKKKMVAFVDDFSAAEKLKSLLQWWATLFKIGPKFGYFPEPTKSWLVTKFEILALGKKYFQIFQSKYSKFWQMVSRFSYRYSCIQEKVRWWNSTTKFWVRLQRQKPKLHNIGSQLVLNIALLTLCVQHPT